MNNLPWVEKYRPTKLEDIVGNENAIQQFKVIAKNGNIPHMILAGSPGTGKTTSIICLAKILLGQEFRNAFLELNASDERGIEVIRSKISMFCKKKVTLPENIHKIIFLDDVDSMTSTAQHALRRIIELHSSTTRFVMACNTSTKIIEAIQSRCSVIRFARVEEEAMRKRLVEICLQENDTKYDDAGLMLLIASSNGDMRKCINNLQSVVITYDVINEETVRNIIDEPNNAVIENLIAYCFENKFDEAHEIINVLNNDGYSALDIVYILFINIKNRNIDNCIKLKLLDVIGHTQMYLIEGGDHYLQLVALICRMINIIHSL